MSRSPHPTADLAQQRRWLQQHLLLGFLQLICALAAVFSIVLTCPDSLARVAPLTWLLIAV